MSVAASIATAKRRFAVPSKIKRLTEVEIDAFEAGRDIGEELLQSIRDVKAGKG